MEEKITWEGSETTSLYLLEAEGAASPLPKTNPPSPRQKKKRKEKVMYNLWQ